MAAGNLDFYADSLKRHVSIRFIMPNDAMEMFKQGNPHFGRPIKALYLLPGFSGNDTQWIFNTNLVDCATRYNLCIISPCGENSFYLDGKETGRQYATYAGKELVEFTRQIFRLSDKPQDTFIGGLSMGGFGALHTGLMFNHTFSKIFALSSALITHEVANMKDGIGNEAANYDYYKLIFGEPSELENSINNPEELLRRIKANKDIVPDVFMAVGTEDFLLNENRAFRKFLETQKIDVEYRESEGAHDFAFWSQLLEPAIKWMLNDN